MGGLSAAVSKQGENVVPAVLTMLQKLEHQKTAFIRVTTPTTEVTAKNIEELQNKRMVSNVAVGHAFLPSFWKENRAINYEKEYGLEFEGHVFALSATPETNARESQLEPEKNAQHIIKKFDGSYAFAISSLNRIVAGRDSFGICPFYFGENKAICALSSQRKALWMLGIRYVKSFPPGNLANVSAEGFSFKQVVMVHQPTQIRVGMADASLRLRDLLVKSTMERLLDVDRVAVAFSGGLDSSVVAMLAKLCSKEVNLVTVGLEDQPELSHAENAACNMGLPLKIQAYSIADVEKVLEKVLWLIEEPDLMKVGIGIPLFWAAQNASRIGCPVLLTGQGADELFGGYHKYINIYAKSGSEAVKQSLYNDLVMSYQTNFQRDNSVCAFHGLELRLPFIDREVVQFVSSLPLHLKIKSPEDTLRKLVLRRVAEDLSLPMFITQKAKKAIQYATGVDRALREVAHQEGLTPQIYIKRVFQRIYPGLKDES